MRSLLNPTLALLLLCSAHGQDVPLAVYTVDHYTRVDSQSDVRFLLDAPAGKQGFITAAAGHLVTPDGKRFRMWGVNLSGWTKGSALLPPTPRIRNPVGVGAQTKASVPSSVRCARRSFPNLCD